MAFSVSPYTLFPKMVIRVNTRFVRSQTGLLNSNLAEYDAINVALKNASASGNVSIFLKSYILLKNVSLFDQGKIRDVYKHLY